MNNIFPISTVYAGVISDAPPLTSLLSNVLNFVLSIVGVLGILGLVVSGIVYITAGGSEERMQTAKKIALESGIGITIALISLILTGQLASFFQ